MVKEIQSHKKEFILTKQLIRSATSIGAMVREANTQKAKQSLIPKSIQGMCKY